MSALPPPRVILLPAPTGGWEWKIAVTSLVASGTCATYQEAAEEAGKALPECMKQHEDANG